MVAILIGPNEITALHDLRDRAAREPVDMRTLAERLATPEGKAAHMRQMTAQTVKIPVGVVITFSIETGHPGGAARHMSMSIHGRLPNPVLMNMIAEELGFVGGVEASHAVWPEQLAGHGLAANVVQLIVSASEGEPRLMAEVTTAMTGQPSYTISPDGKAITCARCGLTSFHPMDVRQRYCGHCHVFHDDCPELAANPRS